MEGNKSVKQNTEQQDSQKKQEFQQQDQPQQKTNNNEYAGTQAPIIERFPTNQPPLEHPVNESMQQHHQDAQNQHVQAQQTQQQQQQVQQQLSQPQTYFQVASKGEDGAPLSVFEIDLITAREKGQEIRYLSIGLNGMDIRTGEPQNAFMSLGENEFNLLKRFFLQLDWNS